MKYCLNIPLLQRAYHHFGLVDHFLSFSLPHFLILSSSHPRSLLLASALKQEGLSVCWTLLLMPRRACTV